MKTEKEKIINELSDLCKSLIDGNYFHEAKTILKAIIAIDESN